MLITAIGSHEELINISPTYQRLYQLQFIDMPETETNGVNGQDHAAMYLPFDTRAALARQAQE